jgi:hypothetical protein
MERNHGAIAIEMYRDEVIERLKHQVRDAPRNLFWANGFDDALGRMISSIATII